MWLCKTAGRRPQTEPEKGTMHYNHYIAILPWSTNVLTPLHGTTVSQLTKLSRVTISMTMVYKTTGDNTAAMKYVSRSFLFISLLSSLKFLSQFVLRCQISPIVSLRSEIQLRGKSILSAFVVSGDFLFTRTLFKERRKKNPTDTLTRTYTQYSK